MERRTENVRVSLAHVSACSEFLAAALNRDPALADELIDEGYLTAARPPGTTTRALRTACAAVADEAALMSLLRRWRRRELARIAWRDLAGWSQVEESLRDLTELADAAIACAVEFGYRTLAQRYGAPRGVPVGRQSAGQTSVVERAVAADEVGVPLPLVTLGMGKLGGEELNFSSDVDLIFLFPEAGDTDGPRSISNEEFFTRLARQLIRLLDAVTEDGFVFRVDLRLRPFGESGPLAVSFAFFENYLQQHGRDWERYAYIKARAITGAEAFAPVYQEVLRPFVYRRYLDFGVFEALREMKALIAREVERRDLKDNIKLGPGGIREIEFIVQAFQLLRGGRDRRLQTQSLLAALPQLTGEKLLSAPTVQALREAYRYLRRLENRLQMLDDRQIHALPEEEGARARLVRALGAESWPQLLYELNEHRAAVISCFESVLSAPTPQTPPVDLDAIGDPQRERAVLKQAIARADLGTAPELVELLAQWRESQFVQRLDGIGRRRLQALVPKILEALRGVAQRETTLRRVLNVLEALGRRSAYLALLNENPPALQRLLEVCACSEFLARQIAAFPLLLDELLDRRVFEALPQRAQFAEELKLKCARVPEEDPERQVEALREFQRAVTFRVALADLTGRLPLMRVSDRLTDIAELILEEALRLAWEQMTQVYGAPLCGEGAAQRAVEFAIVGYGKLGALELGYGSDLDLVFLHDSEGESRQTAGPRSVDNETFFLRLGQRIVHLLTLHSAAGRLYEVDMRLRPSGKGGLMVTQLTAFEEYQKTQAWTWEHQALLRARAVAGAPDLMRRFEDLRLEVLRRHVRRTTLREEVCKMRERMRAELSRAAEGRFDVKQDPGGIADIEFLAQYWALKWADRYAPLVRFSDTIRQLESVASADLVSQATIDELTAAYRTYRSEIHHRSLDGRPALVSAERFAAERARVTAIWQAAMESTPVSAGSTAAGPC